MQGNACMSSRQQNGSEFLGANVEIRRSSDDIVKAGKCLAVANRRADMEFLLMLYADQSQFEKMSQAQAGEAMAAYGAYTGALQNAGVLRGSNRLRPTHTATTVRLKAGKTEVLNGPYAETREQLGGYYLIDV